MQILCRTITKKNDFVFVSDANGVAEMYSLTNARGNIRFAIKELLSRTIYGEGKYCALYFTDLNNEEYTLLSNTDPIGKITVNINETTKIRYFDPKDSLKDIENSLNDGYKVILNPGLYFWERCLKLPDNCELIGYGAVIARLPDADFFNRMLTGGNNARVIGLTFKNLEYVIHSWPEIVYGLRMIDCKIVNGNLGNGYMDCLFQDCVFDKSYCTMAPQGLYLRCLWSNNQEGNAFNLFGPCVAELAMIDSEFDGTDRGPVFNTNNGSVTDNIFINTVCRNINRDNNGNEIFMCEGTNEYSRNTHIHTRVFNCDSNVFLIWGSPAKDNLIIDTVIDGGGGFMIAGVNGVEQSRNIFDNFELRGCGITLGWKDGTGKIHGENITYNVFKNGAIVGFKQTRINQNNYDEKYYERKVAALALDPSFGMKNTLENMTICVGEGVITHQNIAGEVNDTRTIR